MLANKKILITGATGSLGLELCRAFSQKGCHITANGRNKSRIEEFKKLGIKFMTGDLTDPHFVDTLFADIDHVIHCAAFASPFGRWEKFYLANVVTTENIVVASKKYKIKRLIFISTPSIYYNGLPRVSIREDEIIPVPMTNYAKSKLMSEELVDSLKDHGIELITLRPRAIFGPNDHVILPRILRLMKKGRFPLFNNGAALVDFTYIGNVINAIELSLDAGEDALYRKYNITNSEPRAFISICKEIQSILKLEVKYINLPLKPLLFAAKCMENSFMFLNIDKEPSLSQYSIGLMSFDQTLSIDLAQKYLNYRPQTSLSDGLKQTLLAWEK